MIWAIDFLSKFHLGWDDLFIDLAGPMCFLWLQGTLVLSAIDLRRNHNRKKLSVIPYLTLLTNCSVWSIYSAFKGLFALFIPNVIGILVGSFCCLSYHLYSTTPIELSYIILASALILSSLILGLVGSIAGLAVIGIFLATAVYISPLATLHTVIRDRSTQSMPFSTSLMIWITSLSWLLYGSVEVHEFVVFFPSLIGLMVGSIQLFLFYLYGLPASESSDAYESSSSSPLFQRNSEIRTEQETIEMSGRTTKETFPEFTARFMQGIVAYQEQP